jgi:hypothetical protein
LQRITSLKKAVEDAAARVEAWSKEQAAQNEVLKVHSFVRNPWLLS